MPDSFPWDSQTHFCAWTYFTLDRLEYLTDGTSFPAAGKLSMRELTFWNDLASAPSQELKAKELSGAVDEVLVRMGRIRYEPGFSQPSAIAAMATVLASSGKTVAQLASMVNLIYRFRDEG